MDAFAETAPAAFRVEPLAKPAAPVDDAALDLCEVTVDIDLPVQPPKRPRP